MFAPRVVGCHHWLVSCSSIGRHRHHSNDVQMTGPNDRTIPVVAIDRDWDRMPPAWCLREPFPPSPTCHQSEAPVRNRPETPGGAGVHAHIGGESAPGLGWARVTDPPAAGRFHPVVGGELRSPAPRRDRTLGNPSAEYIDIDRALAMGEGGLVARPGRKADRFPRCSTFSLQLVIVTHPRNGWSTATAGRSPCV